MYTSYCDTRFATHSSHLFKPDLLDIYSFLIVGMINSLMFFGESAATRVLEPNLKPGEVGSPINTYMAGVAGGVLQCIALVPCEVIKCTLQTQSLKSSSKNNIPTSELRRTIDCIKNIYKVDGLRGYYRGFSATLTREAPAIGLYFFIYKFVKDWLTKLQNLTKANSAAIMLAGGFAGAVSWTAVYPCDVIKTNLQSTAVPGAPASMVGMAQYLYKKHGMKVFYRGLGTTIIRAFPVNAATFVCYERLKEILHFSSVDDDDGLHLS